MRGYRLPEKLLLGAATSAAQIEGGEAGTNWSEWCRRGKIHDGSDIKNAGHHWENWREDIDIAAAMGLQTYRFSIEWARLEPEPGILDRDAAEHYRREIEYMRERGLVPLLTLHHFTNPLWFEKKGAFAKPENIRYFLRYARLAVRLYGDLVSDYVTFNEPNVYAMMGYLGQGFPPDVSDPLKMLRVLDNMSLAHIRAYRMIHEARAALGAADTNVGIALHMRAFAPMDAGDPAEREIVRFERWIFQDAPARAFLLGEYRFPFRRPGKTDKGIFADFLGINYYTRSHVRKIGDDLTRSCDPKNDYGWEIYPQGLAECMRELYAVCPRPIWITENGTCDEGDRFRCLFLYDQLGVLARTHLPVQRYYHWSLLDNFEWLDGESRRFGLVHVDFATGQRSVKKSGHFYREIIRAHGVTADMAERYVKGEKYHT